jgi:hypothetical protein
MATYSNVPAVSNFISSINRQSVSSAPWTLLGFPEFINYLALFVCPANSYAVIRGGLRVLSIGANTSVGLTSLAIGSFEQGGSGTAYQKINKATCFAYVGGSSATGYPQFDAGFETIYVGPGQTVYAVAAGTTSPSATIEVTFQGVIFTNGL